MKCDNQDSSVIAIFAKLLTLQTGVKATKDSRVEPQTKRPTQQTGVKSKQSEISQAKSGGRTYDLNDVSNIDDVIVYEENEPAVSQADREFLN